MLIASCSGCGFLFVRHFWPPDRVQIEIAQIPTGVYFVALVAEFDKGEHRALNSSPPSELGPVTMHPEGYIGSFVDPNHPRVGGPASFVEWQEGQRYGVVTRSKDGAWRITWFNASQVPIEGRRFIFGGGRVHMDFSQGRSEVLTREAVRELGFDRVEQRRIPE
jgi:hypothetical protein